MPKIEDTYLSQTFLQLGHLLCFFMLQGVLAYHVFAYHGIVYRGFLKIL